MTHDDLDVIYKALRLAELEIVNGSGSSARQGQDVLAVIDMALELCATEFARLRAEAVRRADISPEVVP